jgi:transcriptional regulator with XRE-family HTH domain
MRITTGDLTDWGPQIRRFRRFRALKQSALAEMIGVDQATVSRWESGRQVPDLGMQRRLRDMIRTPDSREEELLKHSINAGLGYTVLCDENRIIRAVSRSFCDAHQISQNDAIGKSSEPVFTPEVDRLHHISVEQGFFDGDVASIVIVGRYHALGGAWRNRCGIVSWTPVPLTDGRILRRVDRIQLSEEQYEAARRENGGAMRLVTLDDLLDRTG